MQQLLEVVPPPLVDKFGEEKQSLNISLNKKCDKIRNIKSTSNVL